MKKQVFFAGIVGIVLIFGFLAAGCGGGGGGGIPPSSPVSSFNVRADGSSLQSTTQLYFDFPQIQVGFSENNITLSNVPGVKKGILYYSGPSTVFSEGAEYTLPISGFSQDGLLCVDVEISGVIYIRELVWVYSVSVRDGIYLGIIKFAGDAEAIGSDAPVYLESANQFNNALNSYTGASQAGTAIYYAVHKALANLKSNEGRLPNNPDSVYVITFTDGLDNMSSGQSVVTPIEGKTFDTTPEYIAYVKDEIATRKINGKEITAYSIGIKGSDVFDSAGFTTSLQNIASPGKSKEVTDFSDVESTFNEIADGLIQGSTFALTTPLIDSGTRVRMTFDISSPNPTPEQAASSAKYIEGTVTRSGTTYSFTNITYAPGITSDEGSGPITGTISGTTVKFLFKNITGYNYSTDRYRTKQWLWPSGTSSWQINSEYATEKVDFGNTVIYLVLDCSTSMDSSNINRIRTYVRDFIIKIYNARYSN